MKQSIELRVLAVYILTLILNRLSGQLIDENIVKLDDLVEQTDPRREHPLRYIYFLLGYCIIV